VGERRTDQAWLDERWADPETLVLVVAGNRLRPVDGDVGWASPADAPEGTRVLLGERDGVTRFAVLADPADVPGDREDWVPLRGLLPALMADPASAPWLFHAVGLAEWHWVTRHCPRCGSSLESRHAGHELECVGCGRRQFPRTDPAVIMAITHGSPGAPDERLLLGHQAVWPEGRYSTLAGFVEPGETFEDAVRREVLEEVGVTVGEVTYFGNQPWPLPASLMIGFRGVALTTDIDVDGAEIADARWFTRDELGKGCESGEVLIPAGISISSSLIEDWYGAPLPGGW
jgi:NAD+ diphosphatase